MTDSYEDAYAPFTHEDTKYFELYRLYANQVTSPLEREFINCAVDAARSTLERMRFSSGSLSTELGAFRSVHTYFVARKSVPE